ncbi:MAG TPA: type IV secretory system conjugative DNA transfer family protein, partial [Gemmatimonadaceae bacterium]|nr:type IV secretory system conjugative DNA transfer family protein [Gemmatimonadaceae bacterium]
VGRLDRMPLRYAGDGHLITIAPTRSGKGVSVIIPNLLTYPGSVVVVDPKGENYLVTARRRGELGSTVIAFDPFGVVGGSGAFNPLSVIDPESPDAIDDARMLADMLVVVEGRESGEQTFWNEEARALLSGLILYVAAEPEVTLRTLTHMRTLLTLPPTLFGELLEQMTASSAAGGLVARSAARLLQKADKERSGVISSAQSHTHFLDSPRMGMVLSTSTVDLATLCSRPLSLYLVLPPHHLETYHRWIRLMIASCLAAVTRPVLKVEEGVTERSTPPANHRVIFLVDEFGHLGKVRPIEQFIGLVGAYGVSFWLFVQDLSQLKAVYTERWQTFLANADVVQTFGNNDWETVEYFSKMTGDATIFTDSENRSRGVSYGRNGSRQDGTAATLSERGRRLLTPDEVRRLGPTKQLLFVKSSDAVLATKLSYFDADPMFLGHADVNPMYRMGTP